jgi:hypothetical protein
VRGDRHRTDVHVRVIPLLLLGLTATYVDATVVRWQQILGPDARDYAGAAYGNGKILVFGGRKGNMALGDTWLWNGSQWNPVGGGNPPSARLGAAMAYDPIRNAFVLFGGTTPGGAMSPGDTYHFDVNTETWLGPQGTGGGPQRAFHAMAYDRNLQSVVMFGGILGNTLVMADLWAWDGSAWTIVGASGGATLARSRHALAFDETNQALVLYGGIVGLTARDDAWQFKGGAWSQVSSAWTGTPRHSLGMIFDGDLQTLLIHAGRTTAGAADDYVHASNGTGTTMIYPPRLPVAQPAPRFGLAMVYDAARKCVVVIGGSGSNGSNLNDSAWEFFMTGQPCTQPTQCATGICVTGVCCRTPCDPPCRSCDQVNQSLDPNAIDGECRKVPPGKDPRFCNSVPGCEGECSEIATCIYPGASTRCGTCMACNDKTGACDQMPLNLDDPDCKWVQCHWASNQCRDYHVLARCVAPGQCGSLWRHCTAYTNKADGTPCNCFNGTCYDTCLGGFCDRAWGDPQ